MRQGRGGSAPGTGIMLRTPTLILAASLALPLGNAVAEPAAWHDDYATRLAALALIETLNADLLGHDSATLTLDRWCLGHRLARPDEHVVATLDRDVAKAPTPAQLAELAVATPAEVRYRRVRLSCGAHIVSEADNWYVPARLTAAMNEMLEHSDTAFGRAVQPLHFRRHTLSSRLLWHPLPDDWEMGGPIEAAPAAPSGALEIPHRLLEHRAILTLPDGTPFSEVVETYTEAVLDFPPPHR